MPSDKNKLPRGRGIFWGVWTDDGYRPPLIHRLLKPKRTSGNEVNGLNESESRRPRIVYHAPDRRTAYQAVNVSFLVKSALAVKSKFPTSKMMRKWMKMRPAPIAERKVEKTPEDLTAELQKKAFDIGAGDVGITMMRQEWLYEGESVDEKWIIMIGAPMDHGELSSAPYQRAADEVVRVYDEGHMIAYELADWLRSMGWNAKGHGSFLWSPVLMVPAALGAGLGELGKHGSIIHKKMGSSFRLAYVLTDAPLMPTTEQPESFGAEEFCLNCQVCSNACPPNAIQHEKQLVRGQWKYYVDFDKCVPFFNDTGGCGICIAVCPWSKPGVADRLVQKMAKKRGPTTKLAAEQDVS